MAQLNHFWFPSGFYITGQSFRIFRFKPVVGGLFQTIVEVGTEVLKS